MGEGKWLFSDSNGERCVVDFDAQRWHYLAREETTFDIESKTWYGPSGNRITMQAMLDAGWKIAERLDWPPELQLSEGL